MATVIDKSGNSPARAPEPHKPSKLEQIIINTAKIAENTEQ